MKISASTSILDPNRNVFLAPHWLSAYAGPKTTGSKTTSSKTTGFKDCGPWADVYLLSIYSQINL